MKLKHSPVGASSCYRWWACPGSVRLCESVPKQPSSEYALEGTAAHELAERSIRGMTHPSNFIGDFSEEGIEFTAEMAEAVGVYYDTVVDDLNEVLDGKIDLGRFMEVLHLEEQFHLDWIDKEAYGRNDASLGEPFGLLRVYDYKHGKGVPVEVINNLQGLYYALGAAMQGDYTEIEIVIVQPRCEHPEGPVRRWRVTPDQLHKFGDQLAKKIADTRKKDAPLHSGDHCRFCDAKAICPTIRKQVMETAKLDFDKVGNSLLEPQALTQEMLVKILKGAPLINDWLASVMTYAQNLAERGDQIPGFKLVKKRANRKWLNEDDVIAELELSFGNEIFERKLLSPAKMEKVIGKKVVNELCIVPDNGNTLVPESDKRPPVAPMPQVDFEPVDQGDNNGEI